MISIIIPSYNKKNFISETIDSVKTQTYQDWELIVVDDNSNDGSAEILKAIEKSDERIRVHFNQQNKGGNYSRNRGLNDARGEYILFLDADDLLLPNCLKQRVETASNNPEFDLWVFSMGVFKETVGDTINESSWIPPVGTEGDYLIKFLKHQLPWSIMQPIWRKSYLLSLNGFDESFIRLQDVELHTRALISGAKVMTFPKLDLDCYYRIDNNRIIDNFYSFLSRYIKGTKQFYIKFYNISNKKEKSMLSLTLLEGLSNILYQRRIGNITKSECVLLSHDIIDCCQKHLHKSLLKLYMGIYNMFPFHPRGLKRLFGLMSNI